MEVDITKDIDSDALQMPLTRHRIVSAAGLIAFILIFTKLGLAHTVGIWFLLPVMVAGYVLLCVISVPVAVAFLIASVQLIAQVSMAHPGTSAFGIVSVVVLTAALIIRWREGLLAEFSRVRWPHFLPLILLGIVFAIGFFRAVQSPHSTWLTFFPDRPLQAASQGNLGSTNSLHYVFLGHWLVYMALGVLACTRLADLKTFLVAFSLLYLVTIFPLPIDFYPHLFEAIYYNCQPMGLHNMGGDTTGSVNRSQVGYLAAMASVISLSLAHHQGGHLKTLFYFWSLLATIVLFLAGSKGPVLGWVIGVLLVMRFADRQQWVRSLVVAGVIASAIGVSILAGHSPIPCGTVKQYTKSSPSYDTRKELIDEALGTVGQRQSASSAPKTSTTEPEASKTVTETSKTSFWLHVLVGEGFGASARGTNPDTGQMLVDAGSHNLFVDLLVDTGVVGVVLFLLALTILIIGFARTLLQQDFPDRRLVMGAVSGMFMVDLVMLSLTTSTYREYLGAFLIGLLMGSAAYRIQRDR